MKHFLLLACFGLTAAAQTAAVEALVGRQILDPDQALVDAQVYTGSRVPVLPSFATKAQWNAYAAKLRQRVLNEVVFRGEAVKWRDAKTAVEIEPPFAKGDGYTVQRFKLEVLPGLWTPGLIYSPANPMGKVPLVLNVNGHEGNGTQTGYIQARCINLARKGLIAREPGVARDGTTQDRQLSALSFESAGPGWHERPFGFLPAAEARARPCPKSSASRSSTRGRDGAFGRRLADDRDQLARYARSLGDARGRILELHDAGAVAATRSRRLRGKRLPTLPPWQTIRTSPPSCHPAA